MAFNNKACLKGSYNAYLEGYSRRLLASLTPEARHRLAEQVQARVVLLGEKPVNQSVYQAVTRELV